MSWVVTNLQESPSLLLYWRFHQTVHAAPGRPCPRTLSLASPSWWVSRSWGNSGEGGAEETGGGGGRLPALRPSVVCGAGGCLCPGLLCGAAAAFLPTTSRWHTFSQSPLSYCHGSNILVYSLTAAIMTVCQNNTLFMGFSFLSGGEGDFRDSFVSLKLFHFKLFTFCNHISGQVL